tara:strand:- start:382 stop:1065 length:684 start_codon:yes stop_codon:yes gene_type:complete
MVNYKSKYLKYKLKYQKLIGGGTCASGKCKEKEVEFKQYLCLLKDPGVAYRNNPIWEDKIDTLPGPKYPDVVNVIDEKDGWILAEDGWLPLMSPDGKIKLFKELSLDDNDIDEALDMDISVNVIFKDVSNEIHKFNINPMFTVKSTIFNILLKLINYDSLGDTLDVKEFVMIFADEELNHSTRLYQEGISDEATIEIDGAREFIYKYKTKIFYEDLRKHREKLGRPF